MARLMRLVQARRINLVPLLTHTFPLEQIAEAYDLFAQAAKDARSFSPASEKTAELGRALRGMGFTLIEKGRLDEAEKLFRECLQLNPDDGKAKSELRYIEDHRAEKKVS